MKHLLCLFAFACTLALSAIAIHAEEKRPQKAFKGIELYSWRDKAGDWRYVLLPGTNREKGEKEVKESAVQHKDVGSLAKAFAGLAEGESVFWLEMKGFELPPAKTREQIEKAAREAKIKFTVSSREK